MQYQLVKMVSIVTKCDNEEYLIQQINNFVVNTDIFMVISYENYS